MILLPILPIADGEGSYPHGGGGATRSARPATTVFAGSPPSPSALGAIAQ